MRKALVLPLMAAVGLAACDKDGGEAFTGPPPGAPPLLAGPDEGAKPGEPGYVEGFSKGGQVAAAAAPATSGSAPTTAGAAPAPRIVPAAADGSKPVRKAGLWQLTSISTGGAPPPGMARRGGGEGGGPPAGARPGGGGGRGGFGALNGTLCVTAESEAAGGPINAPRGGECAPKLSHAGSTWTMTAVCTREMQGNAITTTTTSTLTGDLASKYTLKSTSKVTGIPAEMAAMGAARTTTTTGTYKGPCPAGQSGGDFTGADGARRNLLQGGGRG